MRTISSTRDVAPGASAPLGATVLPGLYQLRRYSAQSFLFNGTAIDPQFEECIQLGRPLNCYQLTSGPYCYFVPIPAELMNELHGSGAAAPPAHRVERKLL